MTELRVSFVDVYVLRQTAGALEVLVLRRAPGGRCVGAWEAVHGRIEDGEAPQEAALRELVEETGLGHVKFYNLSRVESFYRHHVGEIALIPCFAAVAPADAAVRLSREHDRHEWLPLREAQVRLAWPRERRALDDIAILFAGGDAGPLEDVLGM